MQRFLAAQDITTTIDATQTGLTPVTVSYRVVDQDGVEILPSTPVTFTDATAISITVNAAHNALPTYRNDYDPTLQVKTAATRTIELMVAGTGLAAGTASMSVSYVIVAADRLSVPWQSYQSLVSAELQAMDIPNLSGWSLNATDDMKTAALIEARERLCRLHFRIDPLDWQSRDTGWVVDYKDFGLMNLSEFNALDDRFRTLLKRAQVIEADDILSNGSQSDMNNRLAGVVSIKIGESSRTYAQTFPATWPVSKRSMQLLSRYLMPKRITRA